MKKLECQCLSEDLKLQLDDLPKPPCKCIRQLSKSIKFIERIIDVSATVVRVLSICGINDCKAKAAGEVIIFAFLQYDIVQDPEGDVLRKKLRKEAIFYDLGGRCSCTRSEANLVYYIIKEAFKAFYYKQCADDYDANYVNQERWMRAATKTTEMFACTKSLPDKLKHKLENRIKLAYGSYVSRIVEARENEKKNFCSCCFCRDCKLMGDTRTKLYAHLLPKDDENSYRFKFRLLEEGLELCEEEETDPCGKKAKEWENHMREEARMQLLQKPCKCPHAPTVINYDSDE